MYLACTAEHVDNRSYRRFWVLSGKQVGQLEIYNLRTINQSNYKYSFRSTEGFHCRAHADPPGLQIAVRYPDSRE